MFDLSSYRIRFSHGGSKPFLYASAAVLFVAASVMIFVYRDVSAFSAFGLFLAPVLIMAFLGGILASLGVVSLAGILFLYHLITCSSLRGFGVWWFSSLGIFTATAWIFSRRLEAFESKQTSLVHQFSDRQEQINLVRDRIEKEESRSAYLKSKYEKYLRMEEAVREINATLVPERVYPLITQWAQRFAEQGRAVLYLRRGNEFEAVSVHPVSSRIGDFDPEEWRGDDYAAYVVKEHKNLLITDTEKEYRLTPQNEVGRPVRSVMILPILDEGEVQAVLRIESERPDCYDTEDLRLLSSFAIPLALTLQNTELYQQTERLAMMDGLTGLYRRNVFNERIESEIKRSLRYNHSLSLLMIDIDHFKRFNDTYGHAVGDVVLAHVAKILREEERGGMLAARYGGEEFSLIAPHHGAEEALAQAERFRRRIETEPCPDLPPDVRITVSVGCAVCPRHARSVLTLIEEADQALYRAKGTGRNRVCLAGREG